MIGKVYTPVSRLAARLAPRVGGTKALRRGVRGKYQANSAPCALLRKLGLLRLIQRALLAAALRQLSARRRGSPAPAQLCLAGLHRTTRRRRHTAHDHLVCPSVIHAAGLCFLLGDNVYLITG